MGSCSNNMKAKNKRNKRTRELMFIKDLPCGRHCSESFISLCSRYPEGLGDTLRRGGWVYEIKTFLAVILRYYWPAFLLISHEDTVQSPKGCVKCGIPAD